MNYSDYIVQDSLTVLQTMDAIDKGSEGIVFVCRGKRLLAAVTDGDVRRYILKKGDLDVPIAKMGLHMPYFLLEAERDRARQYAKEKVVTAIPIVNEAFEIVDIYFVNARSGGEKQKLHVPVVIMAGGKGLRLKPYTDILPKPLIPIGEKTITEHIMDRFSEYACNDIYMIVNYKKEFIKAYFLDKEKERTITFLEEQEFLGTGGGIKMVSGLISETFFLTNCDILIDADYADILRYHKENRCMITMVCAQKNVIVPYGTVETSDDGFVKELKEKPKLPYNVNTGLYVIEPAFCDRIPQNRFVHITELIEQCVGEGERVGVYQIQDNDWMDMGQIEELEKMRAKMGFI